MPGDGGGSPGPQVLLTELMSDNGGSLLDGDGDSSDWIELYNPGPDPVELRGWGLSDDPSEPFRATLPARVLAPGEFLLLWASGKAGSADPEELHLPFQLSSTGEELVLCDPGGGIVDHLVFPALAQDLSYGRAQEAEETVLVGPGSPARLSLVEESGWTTTGHDDGSWTEVVLPVGYDAAASEAEEENLAPFRPSSQSTDGYGFTAAQAVDDEWSSFSHTADGDLEPWWELDLGEEAWIRSVVVLNRVDCCSERLYNIRAELRDSAGEMVWSSPVLNPVAEGATPSSPGSRLELGLDAPVAGRWLRVQKQAVNGPGSSEWLSLAEVQVWGAPSAPYSTRIRTDLQAAMLDQADTAWLRVPFAPVDADRLVLSIDADDGVVAWMGAQELARLNVDDEGQLGGARDAGEAVEWTVDPALAADGLLAVSLHNLSAGDDDLLLDLGASAWQIETGGEAWFDQPTPGEPNGPGIAGIVAAPVTDVDRGFADSPFVLGLSSETPGATLVYTLDGSVPTLEHGIVVPPASPTVGPQTEFLVETTQILRAAAFREGWGASETETWTWLFLDDVIRQPAAPEGVPDVWDGIDQEPVAADYEMDPEIVDDPAYTADLLRGLRAIPSLSIVMDPEDLFGDEAGIYIHSTQRGDSWERATSVELLLPDGRSGFQEDCGLRIHGYGWRPHAASLKHAFRLEFSSEYGASRLEYPWFPDAPVERFDSVVLRSQGSRSWQDFRDPEQSQYIRDAWARDTAFAMGKEDGHATYVHLYLNGLYWGLYMPVERPDADFAAERWGGEADDWDAINRRTSTNEAIDGDLVAYDAMLALADAGMEPEAFYEAVQETLDLDDLIDYMLIHQYTVNKDGPEIFESNNMRGVRLRQDGAPFRFFVWDMEYSIWEATDDYNIDVDVAGSISHVYARLRESASFRARYAARARMHLDPGGALSPDAALERWELRAEEIEDAVVAESARWGDARREPPYTRDQEWAEERRRLTEEFFPARTAVLIQQLTAAGLYTPD